VSTVKKSQASRPSAWARRNLRQDVSRPRGAGWYLRARRIRRTAASLIRWPSRVSSPCTRRYPHRGFSDASRSIRSRISRLVLGRAAGSGMSISGSPDGGARPAGCPGQRSGVAGGARAAAWSGRRVRHGWPSPVSGARSAGAAPRPHGGGPGLRVLGGVTALAARASQHPDHGEVDEAHEHERRA